MIAPSRIMVSMPIVAPIACPVTTYVPWMTALSGGIEINTADSRMKTVQCFDAAKLPRAAQKACSSVAFTSFHSS